MNLFTSSDHNSSCALGNLLSHLSYKVDASKLLQLIAVVDPNYLKLWFQIIAHSYLESSDSHLLKEDGIYSLSENNDSPKSHWDSFPLQTE